VLGGSRLTKKAKSRGEMCERRRITLRLLSQVEERGDLRSLFSELNRKIDEPFDLERRGGEINPPVSSGRDVLVVAASVIRQDDPFVLALRQVVLNELAN
jgi:hypothetical protein